MEATVAAVPQKQIDVLSMAEPLWNTFERDRDRLYDQYIDVPYDPQSGLSPAELEHVYESELKAEPRKSHLQLKARLFELVCTCAQIHVEPWDWFPDKFNHCGLLARQRQRWHAEARAGELAEDAAWFDTLDALGIGRGSLDTGHISPGWNKMFSVGLLGLIEEAERNRARCGADPRRQEFYAAVRTVCSAVIALSDRFAAQAEQQARRLPTHRQRLLAVADCCRRVPAHPPQTLQQALYFAWLMHELIEFEGEAVRSLGHFDQMFLPYYRADLDAGRLTPKQAKELFKYYWIKSTARTRGTHNGAHFCLGGQWADGSDATNELTTLILDAYRELNAPDPKLSVRFHSGTPDRLYRQVLDMIRNGHNAMVLMNDDLAIPALVKRGKTLPDARSYLPIGCYEPAVDGKEAACTTNLVINLAKPVELALHNGVDPLSGQQVGPQTGNSTRFDSFDQFLDAYTTQIGSVLERSVAAVAAHERHWSQINPSPLIAATIDDCLERGLDIGQGGCHYNAVGCVGAGLANAADSLLAIRQAVLSDRPQFTMQQIIQALQEDFEGHASLREYLIHRVPKWGNGDPDADRLAQYVANHYCGKIHSFRNERGGPYQAALYSFTFQWTLGQHTGALPDGRAAHTPLAPGVGPMAGRDRAGITALLASVSKIDFTETPNGSVLDLRLHPSSVRGPDGLDALISLVRIYLQRGVYALQFNVVDADTLRAAQRYPEAYATLQVRVAGYSAYFCNLTKDVQDHLIAQCTHTP